MPLTDLVRFSIDEFRMEVSEASKRERRRISWKERRKKTRMTPWKTESHHNNPPIAPIANASFSRELSAKADPCDCRADSAASIANAMITGCVLIVTLFLSCNCRKHRNLAKKHGSIVNEVG